MAPSSPLNRRIRLPDDLVAATTTRPDAEVDPAAVGMSQADVDAIWDGVMSHYRTRAYPAIAFCLRRGGRVVINRAIGHARGNAPGDPLDGPRVAATPDTPFCIFSASKALTAIIMHRLDEQNLLRLDDPVCEYIPGFERHGKRWITIRHVMTHRAGIPSLADLEDPLSVLTDWDGVIARLCDTRPSLPPGRRLAYHAVTGGFVLGEVARRAAGRRIERILAEDFAAPLGCRDLTYGVPRERLADVAESAFTGWPVPFPVSRVFRRAFGLPVPEAVAASNDPRFLTSVIPAGNAVATADDLCRFFQMLLDQGQALDGARVLDPRTVRRARIESAWFELDLTLGIPVRYGQGLMLGSRNLSMFGPRTRKAFGHYGFVTIIGWADPARDLSAAMLTSGKAVVANVFPSLWRILSAVSKHCPSTGPRRSVEHV